MTSRILVVDDDTALAEMIGIVLRTEGFEPVFCADRARAVDEWRTQRPDLVLLDLMLPGMDGFEVCRTLRRTSDIPVIMVSARGDSHDIVAGLEAGYAFSSWPKMGEEWFPAAAPMLEPFLRNFVDNPIVVQFVHLMSQ